MQLRTKASDSRVEMQMTPMIDMVFQLLIYFLFTFRITSQEGDFNIKLPKLTQDPPPPSLAPAFTVRLVSDEAGRLRQIVTAGRTIPVDATDRASVRAAFDSLLTEVKDYVGQDTGPDSFRTTAEAKITADYNVHYRYVIDAITNVSGYREPSGHLVRLIQNIQFEPAKPKQPIAP